MNLLKSIKILTFSIMIILITDYYFGKIDVMSKFNIIDKIELNNTILKEESFTKENNEKYTYYKESFIGIHKCSIYIKDKKIIKKEMDSKFYLL